jgi:hypothetical protein
VEDKVQISCEAAPPRPSSQAVISSDAQKGLGFVPDYQVLTAWDEAERIRRQT